MRAVHLLLGAALAALSLSGLAKVAAEAPMGEGVVLLHDVPGPCVGGALLAQYVAPDGATVPGCWMKRTNHVAIVFLDCDVATVPEASLREPKSI